MINVSVIVYKVILDDEIKKRKNSETRHDLMLNSYFRRDEEVAALKEELARAKANLAEVLDECVYAEQQRNKAEEHLELAQSQVRMDRALLGVIEQLTQYIAVLEHQVLLPALNATGAAVLASVTETADVRTTAQQRLQSISDYFAATALSAVGREAPAATQRALSLIEPPTNASAIAAMKRQQLLCAPCPFTNVEDAYVATLSMMSTTEKLRGIAAECLESLSERLEKQQQPTSNDPSSSGDSHVRPPLHVNAHHKRARDHMEEALSFLPQGQHMVQLTQRIVELEELDRAHQQERREVGLRFETLQRAIVAAREKAANPPNTVPAEDYSMLLLQTQHQTETLKSQQEEIVALHRELKENRKQHEQEIEELKKQLATKQKAGYDTDQFVKSLQPLDAYRSSSAENRDSPGRASSDELIAYQTKLRAFELTVTALNTELALVEDKLTLVEQRAEEDAAEADRQREEQARRHKEELDECDAVVSRMTEELEGLIRENGLLKQKLRVHRTIH